MEWSSACLIPLAYIIVEAIFIDGSNRNTRFYIIFLCGIGSVLELSFFVSFIQYQYSCTKKTGADSEGGGATVARPPKIG